MVPQVYTRQHVDRPACVVCTYLGIHVCTYFVVQHRPAGLANRLASGNICRMFCNIGALRLLSSGAYGIHNAAVGYYFVYGVNACAISALRGRRRSAMAPTYQEGILRQQTP